MCFTRVFLKAGFLTGTSGLARALTPLASDPGFHTPVDALGVPFGAFEKKLSIEPFFEDPALEACLLRDGGAGVNSPFSFFTMIADGGTKGDGKPKCPDTAGIVSGQKVLGQ